MSKAKLIGTALGGLLAIFSARAESQVIPFLPNTSTTRPSNPQPASNPNPTNNSSAQNTSSPSESENEEAPEEIVRVTPRNEVSVGLAWSERNNDERTVTSTSFPFRLAHRFGNRWVLGIDGSANSVERAAESETSSYQSLSVGPTVYGRLRRGELMLDATINQVDSLDFEVADERHRSFELDTQGMLYIEKNNNREGLVARFSARDGQSNDYAVSGGYRKTIGNWTITPRISYVIDGAHDDTLLFFRLDTLYSDPSGTQLYISGAAAQRLGVEAQLRVPLTKRIRLDLTASTRADDNATRTTNTAASAGFTFLH